MLPKFIQCLHTFTAYIFPTFNLLFRPYSCKMCRLCWRKKEKNKHSRKENSFFCYFTHRWNEICVWVRSIFFYSLNIKDVIHVIPYTLVKNKFISGVMQKWAETMYGNVLDFILWLRIMQASWHESWNLACNRWLKFEVNLPNWKKQEYFNAQTENK